jgi:hypothetical protein
MCNFVYDGVPFSVPKGFAININESGILSIGDGSSFSKKPEYISDTVKNLKYGSVASQVRALVDGQPTIVIAHSKQTIRSALNKNYDYSAKIEPTGNSKEFLVTK